MSRGQQGIGISAAGMYGVLTTGKPVKIVSKVSPRKPAHYYEIKIDTKSNLPEILNGRGEGEDIPPGEAGSKYIEKHGIEWIELDHGTRVTIELEGRFIRGRGSVDEYLEQTAIANPHVTIHYLDPESGTATQAERAALRALDRSTAARAQGNQAASLRHRAGHAGRRCCGDAKSMTLSQFLTVVVQPRQPGRGQPDLRDGRPEHAGQHHQDRPQRSRQAVSRDHADQDRRAVDRLHLADRRRAAAQGPAPRRAGRVLCRRTRPPAVYRGNPVPDRSGAGLRRHVERQPRAARRARASCWAKATPARCGSFCRARSTAWAATRPTRSSRKPASARAPRRASSSRPKSTKLHEAMRSVNLEAGQTMNVLRYANRVPLQFQHAACAITQMVMGTNWRSLRPDAIARPAAHRAGDDHGAHGQRVGALHQRIERSDRQLSGNSKGAAAGPAIGGPQAGHVPAPAAESEAGRRAAQHLPALPGRSGHGRQRDQPGRPQEALRPVAAGRQEEDRRGRHEARRARQGRRRRRRASWSPIPTC